MFSIKNIILLITLSLTIIGCAKYDPVTGEKVIIEPNPQKKAEEFRDKQGGIFGDINNSKKIAQHLILQLQMFYGEQH